MVAYGSGGLGHGNGYLFGKRKAGKLASLPALFFLGDMLIRCLSLVISAVMRA